MNKLLTDNLASAKAVFGDATFPLPIEQRPLWRIGLICLCIHICGDNESRLKLNKMRVLLWMLIRPKRWASYIDTINRADANKLLIASDSSTDKALELGFAKNFFSTDDGRVILGDQGKSMLDIIANNGIFVEETVFLTEIKSKVSDVYIKRILGS
ncbi:hypothetical protein SAMN05660691_03889 [Rheinheimera pacifica]|uniref:Uncharacterized protein n=1 Tax=Rheinheimera pacifica TaxID=173990 RepID=A0A1H6NLK2_9GAMM|nr:hypothetical protein [Rheinheimera pacifica]SEI12051.1 hypothetical protein SAMN05660691_03889 [Rheinheimera pacifica]